LWDQVREVIGRDFLATRLVRAKFKRSVFCIDMDNLAFADLAFKNVETERIENLFLNRALSRTCTVNRIVTFAGNKRLRRLGKIEADLLLLESLGQSAELDFDNFLEVLFA
jgi:hypothetical protein